MSFPANTTGEAAEAAALGQEAVMGQAVPRRHPAVVGRSQYTQLRALLAIAMVVIVGSTATVVIPATGDEVDPSGGSANPLSADTPRQGRQVEAISSLSPAQLGAAFGRGTVVDSGTRYDGGPEESGVAAAIGSQPTVAAPDESKIAAAIGTGGEAATTAARPDESAVAAAISGRWRGSAARRLDRTRLASKG
jgi:hypothetical protein